MLGVIQNKDGVHIESRYTLGDEIGHGAFAVVYKAHRKNDKEAVTAVKVVPADAEAELTALHGEINFLSKLLHPNILRTYEVFHDTKQLALVMEFCDGGTVFSEAGGPPRPEHEVASVVRDILGALRFMHSRGIVHRDMKPQNVLVSAHGHVKVVDFGLSKQYKTLRRAGTVGNLGFKRTMTESVGTAGYMAPEVIAGVSYDGRCDVWSLGVITYYGLTGTLPFPFDPLSEELPVLTEENTKLSLPSSWSTEAREFLQRLLTYDFQKRPQTAEAQKMAFASSRDEPPELGCVLSQDTFAELQLLAKSSTSVKALALMAGRFLNLHTAPRQSIRSREFLLLDVEREGSVSRERLLKEFSAISGDAQGLVDELTTMGCEGNEKRVEYSVFLAAGTLRNHDFMDKAFRFLDKDFEGSVRVADFKDAVKQIVGHELSDSDEGDLFSNDEHRVTLRELLQYLKHEDPACISLVVEDSDGGGKSASDVDASGILIEAQVTSDQVRPSGLWCCMK